MKNKRFKKGLVAVIMSLTMVFAMMPGLAFADTVSIDGTNYTSSISIDDPGTIIAGTQATMAATYSTDYTGDVHVDWAIAGSSTDTGTATINKHQGVLTPTVAGTITISATLKTGTAGSGSGTSSGSGTGCTGTTLATISGTYTIGASSTYGYQGTGGNTMKMLDVNGTTSPAISATVKTSGSTVTGYDNVISMPTSISPSSGKYTFGFTMSAGVNNFNQSHFETYCIPAITVTDTEGNVISGATISYVSFNTTTKIITISVSDSNAMVNKGMYKIVFGSAVCGNNESKNLGVPVSFQFKVRK